MPIASWFVRDITDLAVVALIPGSEAQYALMFSPRNVALRGAIDEALSRIRQDGRYTAMVVRWMER